MQNTAKKHARRRGTTSRAHAVRSAPVLGGVREEGGADEDEVLGDDAVDRQSSAAEALESKIAVARGRGGGAL